MHLTLCKWMPNERSSHSSSKLQFFVSRIPSNSFFCWNKPGFAPIDGKIIRVGNGWKDHDYTNIWKTIQLWYNATYRFRPKEENGRLDIRPNAGNHVMMQAKEGYVVFLAHLRNQSISVTEGQQVRQGQAIWVSLPPVHGNSALSYFAPHPQSPELSCLHPD
jgi:hypothetical protein